MPSTSPLSRLSVRQRLTAAVALLASLALLVVGSTLYVLESRRIDDVVEASLTQEIGEFRALQAENDPQTRKPFTSADRLLTVFLERNLPDDHEALYGFRATGGPTYQGEGDKRLLGSPAFRQLVDRLEPTGGTETLTVKGSEYRVAVQPVSQGARPRRSSSRTTSAPAVRTCAS